MPRNGSGTYSLPNTISAGDQVAASPVQGNFNDLGTEITGSLARDGQTTMTGQFKAANGSASTPSMAFGSDTNTGLYRKSADVIGVAAGGAEVASFSSDGIANAAGQILGAMPTGLMLPYVSTTAPTGWVRANGRTVGNSSSGGTERAAADVEDLFELLWNSYSNTVCPVSSGRGASAAADFAANKTITLPDLRGRSFFGLDDMGSSAAGRLGSIITNDTTNGASGGTETHTLTESQMPSHTHTGTTSSDGAHTHTYTAGVYGAATTVNNAQTVDFTTTTANTGSSGSHTHTFTTASAGSNAAHSNMPPAFLGTWIIKL